VRFVVLDRATGRADEVIVALGSDEDPVREEIVAGQPPITLEEFELAEQACKRDPRYLDALRARGVDDTDHVIIDLYGIGAYGDIPLGAARLARGLSWLRLDDRDDNPYAHPIDNLHLIVDLNRLEVVEISRRATPCGDSPVTPVTRTARSALPRQARACLPLGRQRSLTNDFSYRRNDGSRRAAH
jgi:primary-amine oxidase